MSLYLDTRGNTSVAIGICSRCKLKRPIVALVSDPNAPGLRVCGDKGERGCVDKFDPWRLPARRPENITVQYPRPDDPLVIGLTTRVLSDRTTVRVLTDGITERITQ
jgi:hypothetical protein